MLNSKLNKEMAVQKMNQLLCEYSSILQFVQKTYLKVTKEEKGEICVCIFKCQKAKMVIYQSIKIHPEETNLWLDCVLKQIMKKP